MMTPRMSNIELARRFVTLAAMTNNMFIIDNAREHLECAQDKNSVFDADATRYAIKQACQLLVDETEETYEA